MKESEEKKKKKQDDTDTSPFPRKRERLTTKDLMKGIESDEDGVEYVRGYELLKR